MSEKPGNISFTIRMVDHRIHISSLFKLIQIQCSGYIDKSLGYDFSISSDWNSICEEKRIGSDESVREGIEPGMDRWESAAIYRKIIAILRKDHYIMMHGVVISMENEGYMITAPSGTGKTTRARIWMEEFPGSFVVNGDKPLIQVTDEGAYAWGTPWCGKEGWSRNTSVQIRAIYLLERAEKDSIEEVKKEDATREMWGQTFFPRDFEGIKDTIELVNRMKEQVQVFRYRSTMTANSVRMAYKAAQAAGPKQRNGRLSV